MIAHPNAKRCADCPATFAPGSTRRRCKPCQAEAVRRRDRARVRVRPSRWVKRANGRAA